MQYRTLIIYITLKVKPIKVYYNYPIHPNFKNVSILNQNFFNLSTPYHVLLTACTVIISFLAAEHVNSINTLIYYISKHPSTAMVTIFTLSKLLT
ncbi:hypothetical protein [Plasmodium yoelii yoelii]|uniref:Uncharacterized protein n=1 Tax=Plasmodium yoelii yoelii TaxID=73239 RepID=Q7PDE3_PLAYO|nr:hypothetical protein [Plasmodium yoelii yoelii]EAA18407.1 hypothetical protein [Plasmodium yoelii yoelii]EAA20793.1 hypothetical protein [Plasmodium yoelii yoelii]